MYSNPVKRHVGAISLVLTLGACGGGESAPAEPVPDTLAFAQPVSLIIDTDFSSDVDDVGALAIAHALVDRGEAKLLAVMVNTPSRWGAPAVDAVNTWFGHAEVPVGTLKPVDDSKPSTPPYPQQLATTFPNRLQDGANAPDAVTLYRQVLSNQPDGSVVIASVGYLSNLARLLDSKPDEVSALDGRALVARKVKLLSLMGGQYPAGAEWNFISAPDATRSVVGNWPTRVIFSGYEVGVSVGTGSRVLAESSPASPVRSAYALYLGGEPTRPSWDPIAVYLAVRGTDTLFKLAGQNGQNAIDTNGANRYTAGSLNGRNDAYIVKMATDAQIAAKLDELMVQSPAK